MTWAKIDDRFYSNRKVQRAWKLSRASIGLHVMALAYCAGHEYDGEVDAEFTETMLPKDRERQQAITALVSAGLWHEREDGWVIHDYLEFNPSAAELAEKRRVDAERKAAARAAASARTNGVTA